MQQSNELASNGFEQFDEFIRDLAVAILSNARDFEGVWDIANQVYDRWNPAERPRRSRSEQGLALSA